MAVLTVGVACTEGRTSVFKEDVVCHVAAVPMINTPRAVAIMQRSAENIGVKSITSSLQV